MKYFLKDLVVIAVFVVIVLAVLSAFIPESKAKLTTPSRVVENIEYFKVLYIQDELTDCWYMAIKGVGITPRMQDDGRQYCK